MRLALLIALLLCSGSACAMPQAMQALGMVLTFIPGFQLVGYALLVGSNVYGAAQQRKAAASQREAQRQAYNASLKDRTITRVATDAPHRIVYGRARVGSDIVAMFSYGARDEYKYLVCVHAAHECDAIEEVFIAGKALGTLDSNGDVTSGDYCIPGSNSVADEAHTGTSFTLAHTPVPGTLRVTWLSGDVDRLMPFTLAGAYVTVAISYSFLCHYEYASNTSRVRVLKHLGTPADTADAELMAQLPALWPSTAVLRGLCYTVVRLDLAQAEFQSGIPAIEVLLRGKKLYDPRTAATAWSKNPALVIYDYLTSELCGIAATDLPVADYITAANVCDEDIGAGVLRYEVNGTVTADQDARKVLESLAQAMAGAIVGTTWQCYAGKYIAPVMALDQSDIVGAMSILSGTADADLYNGVRGQFITAENSYVNTDFRPFQNAAYLAADGREFWTNIDFPFTDTTQRVHNLCCIFTEDQRNGFTIKAVFSLKTWALKVGQRVTFTSTVFGQSAKVYRVTDKRFGPDQAVELTLKEDAASIWDLADAVVVDATPNTNLPGPYVVGIPGSLSLQETIYETTGSAGVKSRATLTWTAPPGVNVTDYEVEYKLATSGVWLEIFSLRATSVDFFDMAPDIYDFRVKARNTLGAIGPYCAVFNATIYGLTAAPANVANFTIKPMAGMALASWDRTVDLDVKIGGDVVIRWSPATTGASWESSVVLPDGLMNGDATSALVSLATGTYFAKFVDSAGHYSDTAASFVATEAVVTGWTTVATVTEQTAFAGTKTNLSVVSSMLQITTLATPCTGEYLFTATLDLTTVAARRFHAHVLAYASGVGDLISARGLVSTWTAISGASVNDCNVTIYASTSTDNIAYSGWVPFLVADFNCRYAKFKAVFNSAQAIHNIAVAELSITVKV